MVDNRIVEGALELTSVATDVVSEGVPSFYGDIL